MNVPKLFLHSSRNGNFYRKIYSVINVLIVISQLFILCSEAYYLDNNPYRHKQILGPKASYVVEWSVNWKDRSILFQVSAETKGWIGFGLSRDGRMLFSDAIVGGVDSFTGKPYFQDVHVKGNRSLLVDERQDWKLIGAWEKGKRTYLSFTRAMDTCDLQDYPITKDLVALIWAYGETDEIQYHQKRRGSAPVYLLDPVISEEIAHELYRQIGPHSNLYLVQRWAVTNKLRLSTKPTSVWCSLERGPRLLMRHDIVGMGAFLPTKLARQHVQQMLLYKCTAPQETEAKQFFDPYANLKGEECYMNEKRTLPLSNCRELIYVWGRGGKPFYFPEDIGIPIGESQNEYYLLETHFDNPKAKPDLDLETGLEIIYSHRQKSGQASLLQIGYGPFGTFMIPPKTTMNIYGSCGPACTSIMFPKNGANIFAVMLQTHSLGRRIRLKHFRNGNTELPWVLKDDNYDSEYQQMRLLTKSVTVLPGDQLTTECTFDSSERNRTSFSGFSTYDEVCSAFVYISNRIPFFRCTSELPADRLLSKYGISNFTWDTNLQDRYVTSPKGMEGTWIGDIIDDESQLSKPNYQQLQQDFKYSPHLGSCPNIHDMMAPNQDQFLPTSGTPVATRTPHITSTVSYPNVINEYQETSSCRNTLSEIPSYQGNKVNPEDNLKPTPPHLPSSIKDQPFSFVPPAPHPPAPPPQQNQDLLRLLTDGLGLNRPSSFGNGISIPPFPPQPPIDFKNILRESPGPSSFQTGNRIPVALPPAPPPVAPAKIKKKPKTNSVSNGLPIPPGHSRPPILSPNFNNILIDNSRDQNRNPFELRIPMVQGKQPDPTTDKSIKNFFDQIANFFSPPTSPKTRNKDSFQNGLSFQQHIGVRVLL